MKKIIIGFGFVIACSININAQQSCFTSSYWQNELRKDPSLKNKLEDIESFIRINKNVQNNNRTSQVVTVIKIPVIIHLLYRVPEENINTQIILQQLEVINRDFRKKNADTVNTPSRFRSFASDLEIEFVLAKSDPLGRSTNGIQRKYSPIKFWYSDDKMKFNTETGLDAWDTKSYLNIWICNLKDGMGYSSLPGGDVLKDGVVLDYKTISGNSTIYNNGRTAVHEIGHWLNLRHLWGDNYCGDDNVDDTPKQSTFTPGCPGTGIRISCGNSPNGDMFMNYMDFTDDACMNMFSHGQKQRARSLFQPGGARNSILNSKGLDEPTIFQTELPDFYPKWDQVKIYPNPASNQLNISLDYDERWVGKEILILDISGRILNRKLINTKNISLDINSLKPGIYFIRLIKDDEIIHQKFIKT